MYSVVCFIQEVLYHVYQAMLLHHQIVTVNTVSH